MKSRVKEVSHLRKAETVGLLRNFACGRNAHAEEYVSLAIIARTGLEEPLQDCDVPVVGAIPQQAANVRESAHRNCPAIRIIMGDFETSLPKSHVQMAMRGLFHYCNNCTR